MPSPVISPWAHPSLTPFTFFCTTGHCLQSRVYFIEFFSPNKREPPCRKIAKSKSNKSCWITCLSLRNTPVHTNTNTPCLWPPTFFGKLFIFFIYQIDKKKNPSKQWGHLCPWKSLNKKAKNIIGPHYSPTPHTRTYYFRLYISHQSTSFRDLIHVFLGKVYCRSFK